MAKRKNKKISAEQVHKKRGSKSNKVLNPFEIHVNKEKLKVLGKKEKSDRGLPGISRGKAIKKRKQTLLKEYKGLNKTNKFVDHRLGEKNYVMTQEDKAMARFTAERAKKHNKKSIFNLADDEILTHKGQTLSEIEKIDDPRSDEESLDDENDSGRLDKHFVEGAHFGGGVGVTSKTGKGHKELIYELITESKKRKAEQQKTKETILELTEKLDSEWKDLMPIVNTAKKTDEDIAVKPKIDDYDKVMRQLKFEARGTVSDRLKTEDEIAKEEKDKLEQLERDRLERMRGKVKDGAPKHTHRSADDLDDDIVYETDADYTLSYNEEGTANVQIDAEINGKSVTQPDESENEEEMDGEDSNSEEESECEDNLSDLKEDSDDENETEDLKVHMLENGKDVTEELKELNKNNLENREENNLSKPQEKLEEQEASNEMDNENANKIKEIMEQARKELPYTFALPETLDSLRKTLENQSSHHQSVILERMIKCNHPSLAQGNKENLSLLLANLFQYIHDLFEDVSSSESIKQSFEILAALVPHIYDLAQLNPEDAHKLILELINEKHSQYIMKRRSYPGYEVLAFLKLVSLLFPTSDFRHRIVTPCFVFIEQMLTKCKIDNKRDISYGLFISTLVLEYTVLSKRYLPAVINFLSGLLHMAVPKSKVKLIKVLPPFKPTVSSLVLLEDRSSETFKSLNLNSTDLINGNIDEDYKIRVLYITTKLLREFFDNLQELPSSVQIFEPVLKYLELIPTDNYPKEVRSCLECFINVLKEEKASKKLTHIAIPAPKPKALRLYEPKIEVIYDCKRFKEQSEEKMKREIMLHKLKKETKGALREIRRDKAFLGRVKINERLQSDKERREKVKRLYSEAAMQQSELNAMDRKKKKK